MIACAPEGNGAISVCSDELTPSRVPTGGENVSQLLLPVEPVIGNWLPCQSVPQFQVVVSVANQQLNTR